MSAVAVLPPNPSHNDKTISFCIPPSGESNYFEGPSFGMAAPDLKLFPVRSPSSGYKARNLCFAVLYAMTCWNCLLRLYKYGSSPARYSRCTPHYHSMRLWCTCTRIIPERNINTVLLLSYWTTVDLYPIFFTVVTV